MVLLQNRVRASATMLCAVALLHVLVPVPTLTGPLLALDETWMIRLQHQMHWFISGSITGHLASSGETGAVCLPACVSVSVCLSVCLTGWLVDW